MEENPRDPYEYEVDLRDYVNVIWEQKWLIVGITVIALVLAGGYSLRQPETYRTQATLLITPRVSEQIVSSNGEGLNSVSLPSLAYERSAKAADLLETIIKDLDLKNDQGELISQSSLKNRLEVSIDTRTRNNGGETLEVPLVTMTVTGGEPERIKNVANKWAELFQNRTTEIFSSEIAQSFQFISERFQAVQQELQGLEEEKQNYMDQHPLNTLKNEVNVLQSKYSSFLSQLEEKKAKLNSEETRLVSLQEALKEEPKFLQLNKSVSKEAIWRFLDGEISSEELENLPGLNVSEEVKNETYFSLKRDLNRTKINVSTLKEEATYFESKTKDLKERITAKQARIDRVEMKLGRLDRKIDRLKDSYQTLSSNLEEARIANEEKESSVRLMERAVAPEYPLASNTKQNVAVAGVLGLFLGVLIAFFRNYMQGYEEEEEEEASNENSEEDES